MRTWRAVIAAGFLSASACGAFAAPDSTANPQDVPGARQEAERLNKLPPVPPAPAGHIDHSGRKQSGRASFYAKRFAHRKMANGRRMNPNADIAASKTLPLGTVAKVTNLDNGKTATVRIEDRGPYVGGRVVDLAPKVAEKLDATDKGVVPVEVKPITLPQPDGSVKLGAGSGGVQSSGSEPSRRGDKGTDRAEIRRDGGQVEQTATARAPRRHRVWQQASCHAARAR